MNRPLHIGLTGGIGTGKSTVAEIFRLLGIPVYEADDRARKLMVTDSRLVEDIKALFGEEAYESGKLNRQYLAEEVFNNNEKLTQLNNMVHPAVATDFNNWCVEQNTNYIIKEAALLFETGSYRELDATIQVLSPIDMRIRRLRHRDPQRTEKQINQIINKQMAVDKARELTKLHIINDEEKMLIPQVLELHQIFQQGSLDKVTSK